MSTTSAVTFEQIERTLTWIRASFTAAETMDARHWITGFFYPDAVIAFNNEPPTKGYEPMISYMERFYSKLSTMKHIVERADVLSDRVYLQVHVEFVVKNDPEQKPITFEGLVVMQKKIDEDKVSFYKIYTDKASFEQKIKMFH